MGFRNGIGAEFRTEYHMVKCQDVAHNIVLFIIFTISLFKAVFHATDLNPHEPALTRLIKGLITATVFDRTSAWRFSIPSSGTASYSEQRYGNLRDVFERYTSLGQQIQDIHVSSRKQPYSKQRYGIIHDLFRKTNVQPTLQRYNFQFTPQLSTFLACGETVIIAFA
mgnify:CR=1 FL=1